MLQVEAGEKVAAPKDDRPSDVPGRSCVQETHTPVSRIAAVLRLETRVGRWLFAASQSPPHLHDGRCPTLHDVVECSSIVLELKLTTKEKEDLVAYLLCL